MRRKLALTLLAMMFRGGFGGVGDGGPQFGRRATRTAARAARAGRGQFSPPRQTTNTPGRK